MTLQRHYQNKTLKIVRWTIVIIIALNSCKLGPNYSRSMEINHDYRQEFPSDESIANTPWWEMFGDTTMINLIWTALENNKDLNRAIARIQEANATMGIIRADLYPRINYGADGSSSANTEVSGLSNDLTGGINISYVVDLWGRNTGFHLFPDGLIIIWC